MGKSSPFPSPRPSPRLAYSSPLIPHSPNLNNYEPVFTTDTGIPPEMYGDFGSDTVAWLVGDDNTMGYGGRGVLQENMSPHDMLRSVLGEGRSDEEIEQALELCGYDLSATLTMLMEQQQGNLGGGGLSPEGATIIGKSTTPAPMIRPVTPRNGVVCRFFLSTGQCLRADCRFSHDLGTTICKYWLMGSCLAGDTCIFSHDPTMSVSKMTLDGNSRSSTPAPQLQFHDPASFPSLTSEQWGQMGNGGQSIVGPPPGFKLPISRPNSRQQFREREQQNFTPVPAVDDNEAFPSLSSSAKASGHGKKRRNNRNENNIPTGPSSLADVVRMTPSPSPHSNRNSTTSSGASSNRWSGAGGGSPSSKRTSRVSASHIPAPQQIPWLETGASLNRSYLKHRKEAISHGVLRAKYLQLANSAWQRNDAKSAKEHSRKANNENMAMMKAHKEASKAIYEERNKETARAGGAELFVDLHGLSYIFFSIALRLLTEIIIGLLPDEAVKYLEDILVEHQTSTRPLYAIIGTGHHSKGGKDKLGKTLRAFLDEWKYAYREFSASGDRNAQGGILGIDPSSFDKSLLNPPVDGEAVIAAEVATVVIGSGAGNGNGVGEKKKEPPKGPNGGRKK